MPFAATWLNLEMIILSEVSQKEKDRYHVIPLICGIKFLNDINKLTCKTKTDSQILRTNV